MNYVWIVVWFNLELLSLSMFKYFLSSSPNKVDWVVGYLCFLTYLTRHFIAILNEIMAHVNNTIADQ